MTEVLASDPLGGPLEAPEDLEEPLEPGPESQTITGIRRAIEPLAAPPILLPWTRLGVAMLAGLLIAAGAAPLEASGLTFTGVVLLQLAYEEAWRGPRPIRRGMWTGLIAGFTANAVSMGWAVALFEEHAFLPRPLAALLAALLFFGQALPFVLAGGLGAVLRRQLLTREAPLAWIVTPLALLLGGTLGPMFFPWRVGTAASAFLPLASWASIGGVGLVDLGVAIPAAWIAQTLRRPTPRTMAIAIGTLACFVAGGAALHAEARARREAAPTVRMGVVHTIYTIAERHDPMRWPSQHLALLGTTAELEAAGADVVLWPETSYAFQWPRARMHDIGGIESVLARGVRGPVVFGAITYDRRERWNSVVAIARDGTRAGLVDKRVLMPFSERMPFYTWLEPWHDVLPISLTPAPAPGMLEIEGLRIGILNCYEDLSDEHTQWLAQLEPEVLTNHTNDAWFGPHGAELHLFLSRLRAIETGRDLVRVVNGGVSAHVAWTGEVVERREVDDGRGMVVEGRRAEGRTGFGWAGDWVGGMGMGMYLGLLLARRSR